MVFVGVATLCGIVAALVLTATPDVETKTKETVPLGMPVTVLSVQPGSYPATVTALGEVAPLWESTIKSQVNGRIVFISDRLRVGNVVRRNELLVRLAKDRLEMELAEAQSRLAEATVALLKEEREFNEARKNWEQSGIGGDPQSPLVMRNPQLTAAKAAVKAARAVLAHAQIMLGHADIRAPFDGVIVQRAVNPGEMLFAGDIVTTLYDMQTAQVSIHLDTGQWNLLGQPAYGAAAKLHDPLQQAGWQAHMVRHSRRLEKESRLRTLFLQVDGPLQQTPPLLPGTFVRATIAGKPIAGLLRLPVTALTKQGIVWFVDTDNRLWRHSTDPVFLARDVVYIAAPGQMAPPLRVAVSPNSSFTHGLTVQPMADERK
jgi:RND family efflux transporter MFP subunit